MKNLIVRDKFSLADDSVANSAHGWLAWASLASLRPGLPAGARWVLSAAWCWPGVGLSAGRAGDASDAGGSCRRVATSPLTLANPEVASAELYVPNHPLSNRSR